MKRHIKSNNDESHKIKALFLLLIASIGVLTMGSDAVLMAGEVQKNAQVFKIHSDVSFNGELVSSPTVIVKENQVETISITKEANIKDFKMKLVATNVNQDDVEIHFDVQYLEWLSYKF
ncbi:MAG: hypothetical protein ACYC0J_07240 [Gammaproteobacteria bacterium]